MTTSLSAAAGVPIKATVGGRECAFRQLKLKDFTEFERYLQTACIERAKDSLDGLPFDLQAEVMKEAVRESSRIVLGDQARAGAMFGSLAGVAYLIHRAMLNRPPEYATLDGLLSSLSFADQHTLTEVLPKVTGADPQPGAGNPTTVEP